MKDIFTDLYNKVLGFFRQTEKKEDESTKDVACNRLKFVLMQDRTNLTPELMDRMRSELIELLSKYVEMDKDALELGFEQEGTQMALMLSIPVVRAKDEAEIEAILAKEDEEKAQKETENSEENTDDTEEKEIVDGENLVTEEEETVCEVAENDNDSNTDDSKDETSITSEKDDIISSVETITEKPQQTPTIKEDKKTLNASLAK